MATGKGFHKAHCEVCNRETWHYAEAGSSHAAKCTDHSDYVPGRKHAIPSIMMLADFRKTVHEPSEHELRIANSLNRSLWRNADSKFAQVSLADCDWADGIFAEAEANMKDPNKLYCSFCGTEVSEVTTTTERRAVIRKIEELYKDADGNMQVAEKIISKTETIHACPSCCLNIRKPIIACRV